MLILANAPTSQIFVRVCPIAPSALVCITASQPQRTFYRDMPSDCSWV